MSIPKSCPCGRRALPGMSRCALHALVPAIEAPYKARKVTQPYRQGYGAGYYGFRTALRDRARGRCEMCGCHVDNFEAHHILPLSKGGTNDPANGMALCRSCHRRAHRHKGRS